MRTRTRRRLEPVLGALDAARILRRVPGRGGGPPRYEIFHDVLAPAVLAWRARHESERALGAGARGGAAPAPAGGGRRGCRARRARRHDGARRVGAVAAEPRRASRRSPRTPARWLRRRASSRRTRSWSSGATRSSGCCSRRTRRAWRRRPRPRTCSGVPCASRACARWRGSARRSATSPRCPTAALAAVVRRRRRAARGRNTVGRFVVAPREGAQSWFSGEHVLTLRDGTLTARTPPEGRAVATVRVPEDTRYRGRGTRARTASSSRAARCEPCSTATVSLAIARRIRRR